MEAKFNEKVHIINDDIAAAFPMLFVGFYRVTGPCENASKKCMVEVLLIIVVTDGFPQQAVHLLRKGITVSIPDSLE